MLVVIKLAWSSRFSFNINDRQGGGGRIMWGIFVMYYADYEEGNYY